MPLLLLAGRRFHCNVGRPARVNPIDLAIPQPKDLNRVTTYKLTVSLALLSLAALPGVAANQEAPGIPNFHKVDDHVYRGGQPLEEGWKTLAGLGVKTVIDLRRDGEAGGHSTKAEAQAVKAAGMRYVNIPMGGLSSPSSADIAKILTIFNSKDPVFVHCRLGKDRTGTAVACYRIAHDSWSNAKAYQEAREIGIHWIEMGMRRYILGYRSGGIQEAGALAPTPALVAVQP